MSANSYALAATSPQCHSGFSLAHLQVVELVLHRVQPARTEEDARLSDGKHELLDLGVGRIAALAQQLVAPNLRVGVLHLRLQVLVPVCSAGSARPNGTYSRILSGGTRGTRSHTVRVPLAEVGMRHLDGPARNLDLDGLEHAARAQLLGDRLVVDAPLGLLGIGLDAPHKVRLRRAEDLHERRERCLELPCDRFDPTLHTWHIACWRHVAGCASPVSVV